jgi:hypothetical protein
LFFVHAHEKRLLPTALGIARFVGPNP